jgi:DNA-binding GntR family transcriptional regulator
VDGISTFGPEWPYQKLAAVLRPMAAAMVPDQPLPSIAQLGQRYQLSAKTVRKALAILEEEGLVYVVPSRGAFRR